MFDKIYTNICKKGMQRKSEYKRYSGLHKHHIIPKHNGGSDKIDNITFLTIKEHVAAHFLLWKIHRNVNDLRAMKMLGVRLDVHKRKLIGKWCHENKIGMFSKPESEEQKKNRIQKSISKQRKDKVGIFDPVKRNQYASIGGISSWQSKTPSEFKFWASENGRKLRSSLGGKSLSRYKIMHKPGDSVYHRINPSEIDQKLKEGFIFGVPDTIKTNKGKKLKPILHKRKKVTDGIVIYDSIQIAAKENNITPSAVIHRCKSQKSNWSYVSDT